MEAGAYGIPVLATDVGGTCEIITSGENGFLLHRDFSNEDFRKEFLKIYNMEENSYLRLRKKSYEIWKNNFSAIENYNSFHKMLIKELEGTRGEQNAI